MYVIRNIKLKIKRRRWVGNTKFKVCIRHGYCRKVALGGTSIEIDAGGWIINQLTVTFYIGSYADLYFLNVCTFEAIRRVSAFSFHKSKYDYVFTLCVKNRVTDMEMLTVIKVKHSRIRLHAVAQDSYRRCSLFVLPVPGLFLRLIHKETKFRHKTQSFFNMPGCITIESYKIIWKSTKLMAFLTSVEIIRTRKDRGQWLSSEGGAGYFLTAIYPCVALQPLLEPGPPQKEPPPIFLYLARVLQHQIPRICNSCLWTTSFHLFLVFLLIICCWISH